MMRNQLRVFNRWISPANLVHATFMDRAIDPVWAQLSEDLYVVERSQEREVQDWTT